MAIGNINVDPEATILCGKDINTKGLAYNDEVKKIYEIVDDLKVAWTGTAAKRFVDDIESFRKDYERFGQLIIEVGGIFTTVGRQYKDLEDNL